MSDTNPIVADPWQNPVTWNWLAIGTVMGTGSKRCGAGALSIGSLVVGANILVNVGRTMAGNLE